MYCMKDQVWFRAGVGNLHPQKIYFCSLQPNKTTNNTYSTPKMSLIWLQRRGLVTPGHSNPQPFHQGRPCPGPSVGGIICTLAPIRWPTTMKWCESSPVNTDYYTSRETRAVVFPASRLVSLPAYDLPGSLSPTTDCPPRLSPQCLTVFQEGRPGGWGTTNKKRSNMQVLTPRCKGMWKRVGETNIYVQTQTFTHTH